MMQRYACKKFSGGTRLKLNIVASKIVFFPHYFLFSFALWRIKCSQQLISELTIISNSLIGASVAFEELINNSVSLEATSIQCPRRHRIHPCKEKWSVPTTQSHRDQRPFQDPLSMVLYETVPENLLQAHAHVFHELSSPIGLEFLRCHQIFFIPKISFVFSDKTSFPITDHFFFSRS